MNYDIPVECRPLGRYNCFSTRSVLMLCILNSTWLNWRPITIRQIKRELFALSYVRVAKAKTGFWLKYAVLCGREKVWAEFFIRTCPESIVEAEFLLSKDN